MVKISDHVRRRTPEPTADEVEFTAADVPVTTDEMKARAKDTASKGYAVFRLKVGRKDPVKGTRGHNEATTDPSQIDRWWSDPDQPFNIGINAVASGIVAVDIDTKKVDGRASWRQATQGRDIPGPEFAVSTPSGGEHHYYRHDYAEAEIPLGTNIVPGVDVRSKGYIVAPGSYTVEVPKEGTREGYYAVEGQLDLPPADQCPTTTRDLVTVLRTRQGRERSEPHDTGSGGLPLGISGQWAALQGEYDTLANTTDSRNTQLNTSTMKLAQIVAGGGVLTRDIVYAALVAACRVNGLYDEEPQKCEATFESGWNKGITEPRAVLTAEETTDHEVKKELDRMRVRAEAQRLFREEQAARDFEIPPDLIALVDDLKEPVESERYLIEDWLVSGGNLVIAAEYKTGKTTFVQNLIRSLVDEEPFLDRWVVTPPTGRVALFNFELTRAQQIQWLDESGIANQDRVMLAHLRGRRGILTTEAGRQWAVDQLRANNVQVWIVDPFARAASGIDENSNTEVGLFLEGLDEIKRRAGVEELILITHTGRGAPGEPARARGATRLNDWPDTNMVMTKSADGTRSFVVRGRDADIPKTELMFDPRTRRLIAASHPAATGAESGARAQILTFIKEAGAAGVTIGQVRKEESITAIGKTNKRDAIVHKLRQDGLVEQTGENRSTRWVAVEEDETLGF